MYIHPSFHKYDVYSLSLSSPFSFAFILFFVTSTLIMVQWFKFALMSPLPFLPSMILLLVQYSFFTHSKGRKYCTVLSLSIPLCPSRKLSKGKFKIMLCLQTSILPLTRRDVDNVNIEEGVQQPRPHAVKCSHLE